MGFSTNFQGQLPVLNGGPVKFKYAAWAVYVQDEWKVRPRLTVTLGLRYDGLTQPQTLDGRLWNALDIPNQQWIIGADTMPPLCSAAQKSPCIPDAFKSDPHFGNVVLAGKKFFAPGPVRDNWGPRIGVAWQAGRRTVLRAGYGLYWDAIPARSQYAQNDLEMAVWPSTTAFAGNVNTIADFANGNQKLITDIQGHFPTPLPTTNPWAPTNTFGDDPKIKDSYSQQWNVEVQQEITSNLMFSAAYVGSRNGRLPYTGLANAARQASPAGTAGVRGRRAAPHALGECQHHLHPEHRLFQLQRACRPSCSGASPTACTPWWRTRSANPPTSAAAISMSRTAPAAAPPFRTTTTRPPPAASPGTTSRTSSPGRRSTNFPSGRGKKWLRAGPASWVLGNWQMNYILQARSGQPYNLQVTGDVANLRGSAPNIGTYARPNIIADPFKAGGVAANPNAGCRASVSQGGTAPDVVGNSATWFNPCAFAAPSGSFGNLGRNAFRGSPVFNMDLLDVQEPAVAQGRLGRSASLRSVQRLQYSELGRSGGTHHRQCERGPDHVARRRHLAAPVAVRLTLPVLDRTG